LPVAFVVLLVRLSINSLQPISDLDYRFENIEFFLSVTFIKLDLFD